MGVRSTNWETFEGIEARRVEDMLEQSGCGKEGDNVRPRFFSSSSPAALDIIPRGLNKCVLSEWLNE